MSFKLPNQSAPLALAAAVILTAASGCESEDPVQPDPGPAPETMALVAEPEYSPGLSNTINWSPAAAPKNGWTYLAQRATDEAFIEGIEESGWTEATSHEFSGLVHGTRYHYRVRGRNGSGALTAWSDSRTSIQDAIAPSASVAALDSSQTSLLFNLELAGEDEGGGLEGIELLYSIDGGDLQHHEIHLPGTVAFQTTTGGQHRFFARAVDRAGNEQPLPSVPHAMTEVPEPIIIVDRLGEEFDITNAVLKHHIHLESWEFGLGRNTIRPIIDPLMVERGHPAYPADNHRDSTVGVNFAGDARGYRINDLTGREVVDDVVNGTPIAVTY